MYCPKCERKRRVGEKRKKINGKIYWIIYCLICGTKITLEDYDEKD